MSNKFNLVIENLSVEVEGKRILDNFSLELEKGKKYVLMGPNGSGKSTLAKTLMGHPKYKVISGNIILDGEDITQLDASKRSKLGLFLSFQDPKEISGLSVSNYLRTIINANLSDDEEELSMIASKKKIIEKLELLKMDREFLSRSVNEGFSGGEKKRFEILQMALLDPKIMVLDETDSGLDIDALRIVCEGINAVFNSNREEKTLFLITHYKRMLEYLNPDQILVFKDGNVVQTGNMDLVDELEAKGYDFID